VTGDSTSRSLDDAALSLGLDLGAEGRLERLADMARRLVQARYGAVGIPDDEGEFAQFVTSGLSDEAAAAIGPLPRTHGLLGAILHDGKAYRSDDIRSDPRFVWWPATHPRMGTFLGVPVELDGRVIGAFYLADKTDGGCFDDHDQETIEAFAARVALAVENARLQEERLELGVVEERNRLARELHDSVTQTLFTSVLLSETGLTLLGGEHPEAAAELRRSQELARQALEEMRSMIFELRPPELASDGLLPAVRKHVEILRRVHGVRIRLRATGERRLRGRTEREVFRILQEALANAVRHARPTTVDVGVDMAPGRLVVVVSDDGVGFDPSASALRARHLGLTSMDERAAALGGRLQVTSAPGRGTSIRAEVPVDA
jgi:signal transduction histidine kinase